MMSLSNTAIQAKRKFSWWRSARGSKCLSLRHNAIVSVYWWKDRGCWSFYSDVDDQYRNGFETEDEAIASAEEEFGDQVVETRRPAPPRKLKAVAKITPIETVNHETKSENVNHETKIETKSENVKTDINNGQAQELEREAEPVDRDTTERYLRAITGMGSTAWENVLYNSLGGSRRLLSDISLRTGLSIGYVKQFLLDYNPSIIRVEFIDENTVSVRLADGCDRHLSRSSRALPSAKEEEPEESEGFRPAGYSLGVPEEEEYPEYEEDQEYQEEEEDQEYEE